MNMKASILRSTSLSLFNDQASLVAKRDTKWNLTSSGDGGTIGERIAGVSRVT